MTRVIRLAPIRVILAVLIVVTAVSPYEDASAASRTFVDWRDEAIYMVMTDRFRNGDPSNDLDSVPGKLDAWQGGDLQGVIDELDYIKELGMTAIWITPFVVQTKGGYHGYWTLQANDVDPHLGKVAQLDALVRAAHARGLKVIFDVVLNHLGYGHPWLAEPAAVRNFHAECPINFADQRSVENCWLAGLPDLNTEDPGMRDLLVEYWSYWLTRTGADGVRIDAARHLSKDFLRNWTTRMKQSFPRLWILGEVFSSGYRYQSGYLDAGLDAITDFQTYDSLRIGLDPRGDLAQLLLPPTLAEDLAAENDSRRAIFIDNHDVPRFVGRDAPTAATKARLAQALVYLFTMPGIPILYYGTEIALPGGPDPDNRRPMAWTGGDETMRQLVRDLATTRQAIPALRRGAFIELSARRDVIEYARTGPSGDVALVVLNGELAQDAEIPLAKLGISGAVLHCIVGPGVSHTSVDGDTLRMVLAPRAAAVILIGATASSFPTPWALVAFAALLAAALAAVVLTLLRRRETSTVQLSRASTPSFAASSMPPPTADSVRSPSVESAMTAVPPSATRLARSAKFSATA